MSISLKDQLNAQLRNNINSYEESRKKQEEKAAAAERTAAKTTAAKKVEKKPEEKKDKTPEENASVNTTRETVEKEINTTKTSSPKEDRAKARQLTRKATEKTNKPKSNSKDFENWKSEALEDIGEPADGIQLIYKPIAVDVEKWAYLDRMSKNLSDRDRKITHNEYMAYMIRNAVAVYNGLSDEEREEALHYYYPGQVTNKAKTVGLEEAYWNALGLLRQAYGNCTMCDVINMIIDQDIAKAHPEKERVTKISL